MAFNFLIAAGTLGVVAGAAHSYLGERSIFRPLYAEGRSHLLANRRTRDLLRAVWHIPSLAWIVLGIALIRASIVGDGEPALPVVAAIIFLGSGLANWLATRSLHVGGIVLVGAAVLALLSLRLI